MPLRKYWSFVMQDSLFEDLEKDWEADWHGMPEYVQEDLRPYHSVNVRFRNQEDFDQFKKLIDQYISPKQKAFWFPKMDHRVTSDKRYVDES